MLERKFFELLGNEMIFHEIAMGKLTDEEKVALGMFDEQYDLKIGENKMSDTEEGELTNKLLDQIPLARQAFNKFNGIVESLEKHVGNSTKYKCN